MNEHRPAPEPDADMVHQLGADRPASRFWTARRRWIAGAAVLAVAGLVLFLVLRASDGQAYVTQPAVRGPLNVEVNATGTLQPRDEVDVGAEVSGRIDKVNVDFNDHVTKGEILAELDPDPFQAKLAQSKASLQAARAGVAQNQATLAQVKDNAARAEALFARDAISRQDLETARADLKRAQANLQKSNADVAQAQAQVAADQTTLSKAVIRSPIDGVVLNRQVEPGQSVAASFQTPVLFTLASDLSEMELQVDIDEADIGSVHEGQSAVFTVDAFPQRRFAAKLISVRNAPKTTNGVVTYQGILLVDNSSHLLRPGLTATADIMVAHVKDALLVPNGALRFTPAARYAAAAKPLPPPEPGKTVGRIWVLKNGVPDPRTLTLGLSDGRQTQVLSGDLKPGEAVITDIKLPAAGTG